MEKTSKHVPSVTSDKDLLTVPGPSWLAINPKATSIMMTESNKMTRGFPKLKFGISLLSSSVRDGLISGSMKTFRWLAGFILFLTYWVFEK